MVDVKRSMLILAFAGTIAIVPGYSNALTPSPSDSPTAVATPLAAPATPATSAPLTPAQKRAARIAAQATYKAALMEAQNGRDLAFADANATLVQAMTAAGKDRAARAAAKAAYKVSAQGIITAYRQSLANANAAYKAALQALK